MRNVALFVINFYIAKRRNKVRENYIQTKIVAAIGTYLVNGFNLKCLVCEINSACGLQRTLTNKSCEVLAPRITGNRNARHISWKNIRKTK